MDEAFTPGKYKIFWVTWINASTGIKGQRSSLSKKEIKSFVKDMKKKSHIKKINCYKQVVVVSEFEKIKL